MPGGEEVVYGLYECTFDAAARMVTIGAAEPSDFDFTRPRASGRQRSSRRRCSRPRGWLVAASAAALMTRPAERRMQQQLEKRQLKKQRSEEAQKEDLSTPAALEPPPPPPPPAVSADHDLYFSNGGHRRRVRTPGARDAQRCGGRRLAAAVRDESGRHVADPR